jgi:hypothetical protein
MSIRQLNASYVAEEDRVMFRFTTVAHEEYRLWLTRAVVGQLLLQLKDVAVQVLVQKGQAQEAKAVAEFKQQALEQNAQYTQFAAVPRLPLGAEPVKVKSVQARVSHGSASLALALSSGKQLTLPLGEDLIGKLRLLLQRMNETACWLLPLDASDVVTKPAIQETGLADSAAPKVLH